VSYQRALLGAPVVTGSNGQNLPPVGVPYGYLAIACLVSVVTLVGGYALFDRHQWEMVERL
jgi:hypothetical protein